jgi:primosomal protein N' (replication factor Y)
MRQVSGRAGRAGQAGRGAVADLPARASGDPRDPRGDEEAFWRAEAAEREAAGMPPYGRLAGIIISAGDAASAFDLGQHLARTDDAIRAAGGVVYGPAPAPIARVRGRHRVRLLVKAPKGAPLQTAISRWMSGIKLPSQVRLSVDIDPQSFY